MIVPPTSLAVRSASDASWMATPPSGRSRPELSLSLCSNPSHASAHAFACSSTRSPEDRGGTVARRSTALERQVISHPWRPPSEISFLGPRSQTRRSPDALPGSFMWIRLLACSRSRPIALVACCQMFGFSCWVVFSFRATRGTPPGLGPDEAGRCREYGRHLLTAITPLGRSRPPMCKIIDKAEAAFLAKMARLPDGTCASGVTSTACCRRGRARSPSPAPAPCSPRPGASRR